MPLPISEYMKYCTVSKLSWACRISQMFALQWEYLSLTHNLPVISENMAISHILPKTRLFELHFYRVYGSNFNHCDLISYQSYQITQNNSHYAVQTYSRSPTLVPNTNGKPVCHFVHVCVNDSNLPCILHRFRDMAD